MSSPDVQQVEEVGVNEDRKDNIPRVQAEEERRIMVRFVGNSNKFRAYNEQQISMDKNTKLEEYMRIYGQHVGVQFEYLRFISSDGRRMDGSKTAKDYGLEDGDQIDVFYWQIGGGFVKKL